MPSDPRLAALPALRKRAEEEEEETWRPFPDWEETHEVSSYGRVRVCERVVTDSAGRKRKLPERILTLSCVHGYPTAMLYFERRSERIRVHRATLRAFAGEPAVGQVARHLDGDRSNGRIGNLAWGTQTENMQDARKHGTTCVGERNGNAVLTESDVESLFNEFTIETPPATLAARYGVSPATVCDALRGRSWSHVAPTPAVIEYRVTASSGHWTVTRPHRRAVGPESGSSRHSELYQGSLNGRAKLSECDIPAIRSAIAEGVSDERICIKYGVSERTVNHIRAGRTWRHVPLNATSTDPAESLTMVAVAVLGGAT